MRKLGMRAGNWSARKSRLLSGIAIVVVIVAGIAVWETSFSRSTHSAAGGTVRRPRAVAATTQGTDAYDHQVLSLRPVMYLTLGHPSSPAEEDLSGNGHNGVYLPAHDPPGLVTLPNGDAAAGFGGYGQYVQVPSAGALSVSHTGSLSVEAWIRPSTLQFPREQGSGYAYMLGKGTQGKEEYALRMYSYTNSETPVRPNRISAYAFNLTGGLGSGAYFQDEIAPGGWIMVAFVIDDRPSSAWPSGSVAIYKNGQLRDQVSLSQFHVQPQASDAPFRIATQNLESYFEGAIGKVAVYDYALSGQDISTTYSAMF